MSAPAPPDDSLPPQLELGEDDSAIILRKAWDRTLRALAQKFSKSSFESWLKPLKPLSLDGSVVVLGAPSDFARVFCETKYAQTLRALLEQHLDLPAVSVRFVIATPDVQPLLGEKPLPLQQAAAPQLPVVRDAPLTLSFPDADARAPVSRNSFSVELAAAPLVERYTFDEFVVGKSNRMAHAGAVNVAHAPGGKLNPLFLYGNPGLGKTHLMHAIGHEIRMTLPQARVAYVSGETFTNHYVAGIRDKRMEDFRRAYRSVDIWLVDDIQTIAAREGTKEEFFHTFNTLHQMNRQIVITSDRSPRELRTMDERLRSRFDGGLVVDIAAPEFEMRMAILQKKAILENLRVPDEVIAFMAGLIQSNIRALEGALIKLMAYASLAKSPVTKQLASDVLSSYYVDRPARTAPMASANPADYPDAAQTAGSVGAAGPTVDQIVDAVAAQMGVEREIILAGGMRRSGGKVRSDAAFARQVAMYLAKEIGGVPMTQLAVAFNCKTHTSIAHAHARLRADIASDPGVLTLVSNIRKVIEYSL